MLALGGGLLLLTRGQSSPSAAVTQIKPLHPVKHHRKPLAKVATKKHRAKTPSVIDGMPGSLAVALRANPVVVVALYAPKSSVDAVARDEARQGAGMAGAGFVALNVSDNRSRPADRPADGCVDGRPGARRPGGVFQQPKTLFVRFNGFTDRDTVAQASGTRARSATTVGSTVAWAGRRHDLPS
jgi:hypothetical protein